MADSGSTANPGELPVGTRTVAIDRKRREQGNTHNTLGAHATPPLLADAQRLAIWRDHHVIAAAKRHHDTHRRSLRGRGDLRLLVARLGCLRSLVCRHGGRGVRCGHGMAYLPGLSAIRECRRRSCERP